MSIAMNFGKMTDDVDHPAGLVLRRKDDGGILLTSLSGDDTELNELLDTLVIGLGLDSTFVTGLIADQKAHFTSRGTNLETLLVDKRDARNGVTPD